MSQGITVGYNRYIPEIKEGMSGFEIENSFARLMNEIQVHSRDINSDISHSSLIGGKFREDGKGDHRVPSGKFRVRS